MSSLLDPAGILIVGGSGQLGGTFRALFPDAVAPGRAVADMEDPEAVARLVMASRPHTVLNCAAWNAVDLAEAEPDTAYRVNATSVGALARASAQIGARFVTYSTDFVFDGSQRRPLVESDPPRPVNRYGQGKLAGEQLALDEHPAAIVVRTAWLQSSQPSSFISRIIARVAEGETVTVVSDQLGSPTSVWDLAHTTLQLMERDAAGLFHVVNGGEASRFDLATHAVSAAGLDPGRVVPCTSSDFPTEASRPAYSVLASERLEALGIAPLRSWRAAMASLIQASGA